MALKVTEDPEQVGLVPEVMAIETEAATELVTDMVMEFDVAVDVVRQEALEVITQLTICPFVKEEVVKMALLVPAFVPFTFH